MFWQKVGKALESQEGQLFFSSLIFTDLTAFTWFYVLSIDTADGSKDCIWIKLLSSLLTFTMFGFVIEIVTCIFLFKVAFFRHYGYLFDFCLTLLVLYDDLSNASSELSPRRFLFLLRVPWRVGRLVLTIMQQLEQEHAEVKLNLAKSKEESRIAAIKVKHLEGSCDKEKELRKNAEKMLNGYKDEIDTLREALKIAAMDVAGVNDNDLNAGQKTFSLQPTQLGDDTYYDGKEDSNDSGFHQRVVVNKDGSFNFL
jgi:hypothetical protein